MKKLSLLLCIALQGVLSFAQQDLTKLVNPFIGTGGHGHTYPGATMPFGMVQLSPDTRLKGWDGCSGYHYTDDAIYGFSHTHLNGTGIEDYCDILLQPSVGKYEWNNEAYKSSFSHANEKAYPGYYKVKLDKHNIDVELTTTVRTGLHKYTFPQGTKEGNVLIDLLHRDIVLDSWIEKVDDYTLRGMRQSRSWANKQTVYFVMKFSKPISKYTVALNEQEKGEMEKASGRNIKAYASFDVSDNQPLLVKVGISGVSAAGALLNLEKEQPGFDFDKTLSDAVKTWNHELGKIRVEGGTKDQQTIFYTALYHTNINPNIYQDVDGMFRGTDDKIHKANGFTNHSVFSLWDTYRAFNPLMTIINQQRTADWINTFLAQDEYGGMLPVWELSANETYCMIGYHSVPVITDAYLKGIQGFDPHRALKAMRRYAESDRFGLQHYIKKGFLSNDKEPESVSKTLEYAFDDWCISQLAKAIGDKETYTQYIQRAQQYKNVFDPSTGHMRGKLGSMWYSPFDAKEINHFYTEGNSWQYSFAVQQDISGLMQLHGGRKAFANKLHKLFTEESKTTGRDQSDVTGLIGQYAQGNEPSHHMVYLFNYANEPWNTQFYLHRIFNEFYHNAPDGLIGNEDCGQMSAWFVMSAMGIYEVSPTNGDYAIGTPLFDKVTISLENGKQFVIRADRQHENDFYVQRAALNGNAYTKSYLLHKDIMQGGEMSFNMGSTPNKKWGSAEGDVPVTAIKDNFITPVPFFEGTDKKFKGTARVCMRSVDRDAKIFYAIVPLHQEPAEKDFIQYKKAFHVDSSATVHAYATRKGVKSKCVVQDFYRIPEDRTLQVFSKVNTLYTAGGPEALIDGVMGGSNYRTGEWQSYGTDFVAVLDLREVRPLNYISSHYMQDVGSWIWMPVQVSYEASVDGEHYVSLGEVKNDVSDHSFVPAEKEFSLNVNTNARYIRVKAVNYGKIPDWHPGKDGDAHIFIDEIIVK